jgi:hypothetical protein
MTGIMHPEQNFLRINKMDKDLGFLNKAFNFLLAD